MTTKFIQVLLTVSLLWLCSSAKAGNPPPLFDQPVKVDDSGRPLYNSWERYEYERQKRYQPKRPPVTKTPKTNSTPGPSNALQKVGTDSPSGNQLNRNTPTKNGATAPTPSSVIINRPVQHTGDPEMKLNDFNF